MKKPTDEERIAPKEFLLVSVLLVGVFTVLAVYVVAVPDSPPSRENCVSLCLIGAVVAATLSWLVSKVDFTRPGDEE